MLVEFPGTELDWAGGRVRIRAEFERLGALFRALHREGCDRVVLAGAMRRPRLRPWRYDWKFLANAVTLLPRIGGGDDRLLRAVIAMFEAEGLRVLAAHEVREDLLARKSVPTRARPGKGDRRDAARAAQIVAAMGAVDVGQAVVVAQGLCLGVESIQGTDALLDFVSRTDPALRPDPARGKGVLYKAPKPGQDRRADLPAIGPATVEAAARAGLGGIVVEADGALILDRDAAVARADALGLFIWVRDPADG